MRTQVYVDGFNLYYGALQGTPFKWLDPVKLAYRLLPAGYSVTKNGMLGRPCSGPRSFRKTSQAARSRSPPPGEGPCYPTDPRHTPGATGIGSSGRDVGQGRPERETSVRPDHRTPEGIHSRMAYRHLDLPRILDPDTINVRHPMAWT